MENKQSKPKMKVLDGGLTTAKHKYKWENEVFSGSLRMPKRKDEIQEGMERIQEEHLKREERLYQLLQMGSKK